jgi:hypothetical protein
MVLLGEKSQKTQFTQSSKISDKTKLRVKLPLFHDPCMHVRGGIYRVPVFVFYIKMTFLPRPKYLHSLFYIGAKWLFPLDSDFSFLFTSSYSEVNFMSTKLSGEVDRRKLNDEVVRRSWSSKVERWSRQAKLIVESWTTKSSGEVDRRKFNDEVVRRSWSSKVERRSR